MGKRETGLGLTRDEIEYCVLMGLTSPEHEVQNPDAVCLTIMFRIDKKAQERK